MPENFIKNLSHKACKDNLLEVICANIKKEFGIVPVVGAEIEFYITKEIDALKKYNLKKEKGRGQFEIDISPCSNLLELVSEIEEAKLYLEETAKSTGAEISFHPKPYEKDYGSAMHFHVNFLNEKNENIFEDSSELECAAKSLCHFMLETFLIFAPNEDHYKRFIGNMAPTHVCYGGNNRTVAVRIPDATPKRLEHRLSSPETNPYLALCVIMQSIYLGMKYPADITDMPKIYGNAYDEQYNIAPFPKNINEAFSIYRDIF